MKFINLTPHSIILNDGREFPSEGLARVSDTYTEFDEAGICFVSHGEVNGLPAPREGVRYIVSAMVLAAAKEKGRNDVGSSHRTSALQKSKRIHRLGTRVRKLTNTQK